MSETPKPSAGWYPDPTQVDTQRYWDGAAWTDQRAPITKSKSYDSFGLSCAGIAGVAVIGTLGPWVNAGLFSVSGLDTGDGKLLAGIAVIGALVLLASALGENTEGRSTFATAVLVGLIVAGIGAYDISQIGETTRLGGREVQIGTSGWGIWVSTIAGGILAGVGVIGFFDRKDLSGEIKTQRRHVAEPEPLSTTAKVIVGIGVAVVLLSLVAVLAA